MPAFRETLRAASVLNKWQLPPLVTGDTLNTTK
jgi:hypothetical protein